VHVPASEMSMDEQPADELETRALNEPTAGAIWDIWSAEDEPKLSAFLWRMAGDEERLVAHPIHDANVYVNAAMRQRLWEEEGIVGYRFLQRQGEAVFIPAGCPHQVFNLRSSIKVAEDFVSPEHIRCCLRLTEQFRKLPPSHRRNQDTLGVKDIMLHAVSHAVSILGEAELGVHSGGQAGGGEGGVGSAADGSGDTMALPPLETAELEAADGGGW